VKLIAFKPFTSAADALEQINAVSESQLTDELKNFLELNMPKVGRLARAECWGRTWRAAAGRRLSGAHAAARQPHARGRHRHAALSPPAPQPRIAAGPHGGGSPAARRPSSTTP
jgi:hypothetical protein